MTMLPVSMHPPRALAICLGVVLAVATSGCGGPEKYENAKACGIDSEIVAALTGTDRFTVQSDGADLPFQRGDTNEFTCQVSTAEDAPPTIDATARLTSTTELAGFRANVASADQSFDVAGGSAGITTKTDDTALAFKGWWACDIDSPSGTPVVYVTGDSVAKDDTAVKDLLGTIADRAGCRAQS